MSFKSYLENLNESPMMVHNLDWEEFTDPKKNIEFAKRAEVLPGKLIMKYNGICIYNTRIGLGDLIYGLYKNKIVYAVAYTSFTDNGVVQLKLWRDKNIKETEGLPLKVVFDVMLRNSYGIFTDKEQTADGKAFWVNLLKHAAKSTKYDIGLMDFTGSHDIVNVWNREESIEKWLDKNQNIIWGTSPKFMKIYAFIVSKGSLDS